MFDLAPFLYLALVIDLVAGLVAAVLCFLVGSYLYRRFSGRFEDAVTTIEKRERNGPEIRRPIGISPQPRNA